MSDEYLPQKAMSIHAYPDDQEFTVAGTLPKWAAAGCEVISVVITSGDAQRAVELHRQGHARVNALVDGVHPTLRYCLPYGVTELRLEAGKHEIIHRGVTPAGLGTDPRLAWGAGGTAYHATDPQVIDTILQAGRTYTIRFRFSGGLLKGAYVAEYEGWPPDEAAAWSRDHVVRSHLRGPDPFWLGPRGLRLAAAAAAGPADYVAVIGSDVAFTVFLAFPAKRLAEVSAVYAETKNVKRFHAGKPSQFVSSTNVHW